LLPRTEPLELLGLLDPPCLRVRRRPLVDRRVFEQGLVAERPRRREAFHVEQASEFSVELLGRGGPVLDAHPPASTPPRYRPTLSGTTGRIVRAKVELTTPANDAYQAAAAVARPM